MSHPFQTIEACSLMDPLPRSVVSLLHGEVRPTCSANGQKVAIIGTLTLFKKCHGVKQNHECQKKGATGETECNET